MMCFGWARIFIHIINSVRYLFGFSMVLFCAHKSFFLHPILQVSLLSIDLFFARQFISIPTSLIRRCLFVQRVVDFPSQGCCFPWVCFSRAQFISIKTSIILRCLFVFSIIRFCKCCCFPLNIVFWRAIHLYITHSVDFNKRLRSELSIYRVLLCFPSNYHRALQNCNNQIIQSKPIHASQTIGAFIYIVPISIILGRTPNIAPSIIYSQNRSQFNQTPATCEHLSTQYDHVAFSLHHIYIYIHICGTQLA